MGTSLMPFYFMSKYKYLFPWRFKTDGLKNIRRIQALFCANFFSIHCEIQNIQYFWVSKKITSYIILFYILNI